MSIYYVNRYFLGPSWLTIRPPFLGIAPSTPQSYAGMGPFSHVCIPWSCPPGHRLLNPGWTHVYWLNQILYARNLEFETERHRAWEPLELSSINVSTFKRAIHQLPLRSPWRSPDSYSSQPWSPWDNWQPSHVSSFLLFWPMFFSYAFNQITLTSAIVYETLLGSGDTKIK